MRLSVEFSVCRSLVFLFVCSKVTFKLEEICCHNFWWAVISSSVAPAMAQVGAC